ncbi:EKC/KEOPS complex subunit LAGE3-like [Ailuropoda melanoleuca]|uniref:EKC/KEOPS complex subunit LAGE3-like n=1 Tax=Ailuropoda melanoleuca TaxID=9646 RepID=UPI001494076D|nr:EKC/KEOPS complex subunit LAGE3-like [Ailuropoda melanoleuca]
MAVVLVNPVTLESLAVQVVPAILVTPATRALRERQAPHLVAFRSTLTVPFPSPMEAEIAHRFLTPNARLRGPVQKELSVNGSVLTVRWRAEDPRLLRISIISFLDQLSLVMRTMRRFGPPVSR